MGASALFWSNTVSAIRIGSNSITKSGYSSSWSLDGTSGSASNPSKIIFDTGTSFIYFP